MKALFKLTRPRIACLQILSAWCGYAVASGGALTLWELMVIALGGFGISGSASIINSIWERDIDALMERTKERGLATGAVSAQSAWVYAFLLGIVGVLVLGFGANWLAALIGLAGHLFYILVYTLLLKRTTAQNIVIGGASGAVPPLTGWAVATGNLTLTAWLMFLVIFLWTPPHFWALALLREEDYRKAGVPMLPVVAGPLNTVNQMIWYAGALIPLGIALAFSSQSLTNFSAVLLTALGVFFLYQIFTLRYALVNRVSDYRALTGRVFGHSIVYLSGFFLVLLIDVLAIQ